MSITQKEILLKQVKIVNDSLKLTIISSLVLGSVLALQLYNSFDTTFVIFWCFLLGLSISFRGYLFLIQKSFPANRKNLTTWVRLNFINTIASALVYGIVAVSTYYMDNQVSVMIVYIILAGVSAGAVTAYGPLKNLSLAFLIPIIGPLVITNLFIGDLNHYILAFITSLFVYIIYSASQNLYKTFLNTLQQGIQIRTLTEEKVRMEEMAKLKSDFFASMSHEIRTPLNGIVGLVDLLKESKVNQQQEEYLSTIKKSSDDLLNVINDVLDLSKIESQKLELLEKPTNLSNFANRMITLFSTRAKDKGLELKLTADQDLPNWVLVDEHRLSQICTNLISNAIKFTESGSVRLSIDVMQSGEEKVKIQFKVEDTGIGIPKEKQEIIFNKYDQIASAKNYLITQVGTGLGLSIAKRLVNLMGGNIGVFSKEKSGSIFWFTLDLPITEGETIGNRKLNLGADGKFNLNVLLVDDREINLKVASLMLKKLGCTVEKATNGEEAIAKYDHAPNKYDLIIMDIQMPIMDGLTATKKLREKYPNDLAPVYGLSAQIATNLHKTPEELGFDYYLTKPLALETLRTSLNRLVQIG